jgi:hypothetical protein
LTTAGVVVVPFLVVCLDTLVFAGFLVATAGVVGFTGVVTAGGFLAANIEVVAIAKAIVSKVVFMACNLPGEAFCSLALTTL